ncbi:hypothetical protein EVJ58_g8240 [Rhodofomes roseus]|uniref:Uncharacterized protein n=1 Tax=Rhodofomes roseus TaxID=34475 RepID=A0A4Y9Y247_9APHY|nr:hypothetical protein EVJ58_g8240 [Rhodofomes roseus]
MDGYQSRAYSYAYPSPSEFSEDPPFASDFEMGASEHADPIDSSEEDGDMDVDLMSLPRRISFSTSCERDKPFVTPRPMLATRTARSCPPINDLLNPATLPVARPVTAEAETASCLSVPSLSSTPSCDLHESSPASSSFFAAVSPSPSSSTGASCYSPEPAPPTRVKPTSSLYALLNPVDEPEPPFSFAPSVSAAESREQSLAAEVLPKEESKYEVLDDVTLTIKSSSVEHTLAVTDDETFLTSRALDPKSTFDTHQAPDFSSGTCIIATQSAVFTCMRRFRTALPVIASQSPYVSARRPPAIISSLLAYHSLRTICTLTIAQDLNIVSAFLASVFSAPRLAPVKPAIVACAPGPRRERPDTHRRSYCVTEEVDTRPARAKSARPAPTQKRRKEATGGPIKKRPRVILSDDESDEEETPAPGPVRSNVKSQAQATAHTQAESSEKENEHRATKAEGKKSALVKKKRRAKDDEEEAKAEVDSKTTSLPSKARKACASEAKSSAYQPIAVPAREIDLSSLPLPLQEMQGMLIESLATSRASSLPASSLYTALMSSRPALKEYQSSKHEGLMDKKEWMGIIEDVLEVGWSSSGVFDKVESSVKDTDHQLEAQWFYVPEKDEDQERATLIRSMMPRPGKRSETKKSKQYYWRPLGKISKWDPEDDLGRTYQSSNTKSSSPSASSKRSTSSASGAADVEPAAPTANRAPEADAPGVCACFTPALSVVARVVLALGRVELAAGRMVDRGVTPVVFAVPASLIDVGLLAAVIELELVVLDTPEVVAYTEAAVLGRVTPAVASLGAAVVRTRAAASCLVVAALTGRAIWDAVWLRGRPSMAERS